MEKEIETMTSELRTSDDALWVRIRELFHEKGVDPKTTFLTYTYPEDYQFEYGIIVTQDGHVFQYGFDFLHKDITTGTFSEWNDITQSYTGTSHRKQIEVALKMAKKG